MYYTYIIRCEDNTLYTGITTNVKRRYLEHINKSEKCAKYTKWHNVMNLESVYRSKDKSLASKLEYNIKRLNKSQKEEIIKDETKLEIYLKDKIDIGKYKRIKGLKRLLK